MDDALKTTEEVIAKSLEDVRDTRAKFRAVTEPVKEQKQPEKTVNVDLEL